MKISNFVAATRTIILILRDLAFMTVYVILLLPGFLQMAWFYGTTSRTSISYKQDSCRNSLDIYPVVLQQQLPKQSSSTSSSSPPLSQKLPVVLFFPGGAFTIGYKMWASLFAQAMSGAPGGVLVISADYRNYPFGTVPDMVQDVKDAIQWTRSHCHEYGGDASKIIVIGQSAGAHLVMTAMLQSVLTAKTIRTTTTIRDWKPSDLAGVICLSGVYDVTQIVTELGHHGISESFVYEKLLGGQARSCDPTFLLSKLDGKLTTTKTTTTQEQQQFLLPPIEIWHGTADKSCDCRAAKAFAAQLEGRSSVSRNVSFRSYANWSHTDPIIEAVLEGDHSFHLDVLRKIHEWADTTTEKLCLTPLPPPRYPWCPRILVQLARKVSPF